MMPAINADYPLARKDQRKAKGVRLYETFVARSRKPPPQIARGRLT
jgi:hypothetical protein